MKNRLPAWSAALIASILSTSIFVSVGRAEQSTCQGLQVFTDVARDAPYSERLGERAHVLPADTKAVILGDSVAGRWPSQMVDPLVGAHVLNFAHGGDRFENTSSMVDQFDTAAARNMKWVLVIVGAGSVNRDDPCRLAAKAQALLKKLAHTFVDAKIYIFNIIPKGRTTGAMDERVRHANDLLRRLSATFGEKYVDIYTPFAAKCDRTIGCPYYIHDGVHPSDKGYELVTDAFAKAMGKSAPTAKSSPMPRQIQK